MKRIHVICEGQTEETFIKEVIYPCLISCNLVVTPSRIGKPGQKGGRVNYDRLRFDLRQRLLYDSVAFCTTFFDFYGLPADFPGKAAADIAASIDQKSNCIKSALFEKLKNELGETPMQRFIPYVQMYEFEGLLFSDTEKFSMGMGQAALATPLQNIRAAFGTPEEINDSPVSAPSKRVKSLYKGYDKPLHGSLAAIEIGLGKIRTECHLFDSWLKSLEKLNVGYPPTLLG